MATETNMRLGPPSKLPNAAGLSMWRGRMRCLIMLADIDLLGLEEAPASNSAAS